MHALNYQKVPIVGNDVVLNALYYLGQALANVTDYSQNIIIATEILFKEIKDNPGNWPAYMNLGYAYNIRYEYEHKSEDLDTAIDFYLKARSLECHFPSINDYLGTAHLLRWETTRSQPDLEKAIEYLSQAIKVAELNNWAWPELYINLASAHNDKGLLTNDCKEYKTAKDLCKKALEVEVFAPQSSI